MCKNIASLFESLKQIYTLQPGYYTTWSLIKKLLITEIQEMSNEKGAVGIARAKQIEKNCTKIIFRYLTSMLNKRHFSILLFMYSLNNHSCQSQFNSSNINQNNLFKILQQSVIHNELQSIHETNKTSLGKF